VKSSWATWIQYSWGSFRKIQIAAAVRIQNRRLPLVGSHRHSTISYAMKKYSNVFGKISSIGDHCVASNATTPTSR